MTSTIGALSPQLLFVGNSPYDPYSTGVGTSATGFNTYASLYTYYRCYGSKIRVQWANVGTSAGTQAAQVGVFAQQSSALITDMNDIVTNPYGKVKLFFIAVSLPVTKMYMSTAKIEGTHKKAVATDDTYAALTTANPSNPWYWSLYVQSVDQATTLTMIAYVDITYYCEFYGRFIQ